jgi:hypothetical protein
MPGLAPGIHVFLRRRNKGLVRHRKIVQGAHVPMCRRRGPLCDNATIEFRPLHDVIMRVHVGPALIARGMKRCLPIQQEALQDRKSEAPGPEWTRT